MENINVTWPLDQEELEKVFLIEKTAGDDDTWTKKDLLSCWGSSSSPDVLLVAKLKDKIVGYIVYNVLKGGFEVLRIVIHPKYRKQKIATQLVSYIKDKVNAKRTYVSVSVSDKNLAMHLFLRYNEFIGKINKQIDIYEFVWKRNDNDIK